MSDNQVPPPFNIHSTLGAIEIGLMISHGLFGVNTLQTYVYYQTFPKDHRTLKVMVGMVWLLDFIHAILVSHAFYSMSVTNYGDRVALLNLPYSLRISFIPAQLLELIVPIYFSYRVYRFSRNYVIPTICIFLAVLGFGGVLGIVILLFTKTELDALQFVAQYKWLISLVHVAGALDEIILAVSLLYILWKQRNAAFKTTANILEKLMVWTVQTGLLISFLGIVKLSVIFTMKNYAWLAIFMFLCRVFCNSFLLALNGRATLRKMQAEPTTIDVSTEDSDFRTVRSSGNPIHIGVTVAKSTNRDDDDAYPLGERARKF